MNDISFLEFLGHADLRITLSRVLSGLGFVSSMGTCGLFVLLLGLAVLATLFISRKPTLLPGVLGLGALFFGLLGCWVDYYQVHRVLASLAGPANPADVAQAASNALINPILGGLIFLLGAVGSGVTMLFGKAKAEGGGEEPQA